MGVRMSQSIINTSAFSCVKAMAVLMTLVVLPSPGCAPVINIVLGGCPAVDSRTDVLSIRYASPATEKSLTMAEETDLAGGSNASWGEPPPSFDLRRTVLIYQGRV